MKFFIKLLLLSWILHIRGILIGFNYKQESFPKFVTVKTDFEDSIKDDYTL